MNAERLELKEAFKRVKKERDTTEKELDLTREEKEKLESIYADKMREVDELIEVHKRILFTRANAKKKNIFVAKAIFFRLIP